MNKGFDITDVLETLLIFIIIIAGYLLELYKRWMRKRKEAEERQFGKQNDFEVQLEKRPAVESRESEGAYPEEYDESDIEEDEYVETEMKESEEQDFEKEIEKLPDFIKMFIPRNEALRERKNEEDQNIKSAKKESEIKGDDEFKLPPDFLEQQPEPIYRPIYEEEHEKDILIEFSNQNIVNGIVFREILSKPKALGRLKYEGYNSKLSLRKS